MKIKKISKKLTLNKETISVIKAGIIKHDGSVVDPNGSCAGPHTECDTCPCTSDPHCK